MIVYVITYNQWDDYGNSCSYAIKVFDSKEKAIEYCEKDIDFEYKEFEVE